jgi:hypothetical protein
MDASAHLRKYVERIARLDDLSRSPYRTVRRSAVT